METRKELFEDPVILQALFEHSSVAQLVLDNRTLIRMVNRETERITGYGREELEGQCRWADLLDPGDRESCMEFLDRLRNGGASTSEKVECVFLHRDGTPRTGLMSGCAVGETGHMILSMLDITGQKQYAEMLLSARSRAEASEKLKTAFLGNLSHEIRTPMNAIVGFASLLRNRELTKENRELYLDQIIGGSSDLLHLIDKTIMLSRIDLGQVKINPRQFYVNKRLEELAEKYRKVLDEAGRQQVELVLETGRNEDEFAIHADPLRVTEVLNNLLENAVKFCAQGKITFGYSYVEKQQQGDQDRLLFYVKDTGPGISRDKTRIIFDRFVKLVDKNESLLRGAGLGLAICNDLVKLMGGDIWVETSEGKGSAFFFTLPVVIARSRQETPRDAGPGKKYDDWSGYEVLVAEDVESNYLYIKELLSPTKIKILRARDGLEAVEIFEKHPEIDMVLMDILMPGLDGYEATTKIRSVRKEIPVIAQTAFTFEGEIINGLYAGCFTDYIMKPFTRDMLLAHIKKHLPGPK